MKWIGPAILFYFCVSFLCCWLIGRFLASCRDLHDELLNKSKEDNQ